MTLSMYQASVPICRHMLQNLSHLLDRGTAFAGAKGFDTSVLFNARLAPDMYPLSRQIQIASDVSKGCGARLADVEAPRFEDDEQDYAQLYTRIEKTIAFLDTLTPNQIDGTEDKVITLQLPNNTLTFSGRDYLLNFVHPNVYFHVATAYGILRHNGVEIGKLDFLGAPPQG